jgi:hypothetical protein
MPYHNWGIMLVLSIKLEQQLELLLCENYFLFTSCKLSHVKVVQDTTSILYHWLMHSWCTHI